MHLLDVEPIEWLGKRAGKKWHLGTAEVTKLELVSGCIDQQILGLDVAMANALLVDVLQRPAHTPLLNDLRTAAPFPLHLLLFLLS